MNDARNKPVAVGDMVLGRNDVGNLVVGPIIFIDEKRKGVVLGSYQANSTGSFVGNFELADSVKFGVGPPITPPGPGGGPPTSKPGGDKPPIVVQPTPAAKSVV